MARVGTSSDFKSAAFRSGIPMLKTMLLLMECLGLVNPKKAAANGRSLRGDTKINFIRHWWHALRNPFVRYWFWSPWKKGLNLPRPAVILITITKPWLSIHIFLVLNIIFLQIWLKNLTQGDVHWDMDGLCSNAQIVNQAHSFLLFKTRSWNELFWQWAIKVLNLLQSIEKGL